MGVASSWMSIIYLANPLFEVFLQTLEKICFTDSFMKLGWDINSVTLT